MNAAFFPLVLLIGSIGTTFIILIGGVHQKRISSSVRVAEIREALRYADPTAEFVIRPDASHTLSVEMITEVAVDEGFRFVRDTTMVIGEKPYPAMVFVGPAAERSHDG